jgi:hypothetical protein
MVAVQSRRLAIPRHIAGEQEHFSTMSVEMAATPHDDVTRRVVELRRTMAQYDYVNLLLVIRVAESMMREQRLAGVVARRSGLG